MGHLKTAPPHPSQCAHWDSPPLLAPFGRHFPLTGGISLPPGEGILTPNPPAQNRRPVINVICNSTHVTIPDINITWESNPTHGPARCQYYVPICSGTGSVTPAFCAAINSICNFQSRSRRNLHFSPAAPSEITWTARLGGRALQSVSQRAGGHMGPPLRLKRTALITGSAPLIRLAFGQPPFPNWRAGEDTRPYADAGPVPDRPAGAHGAPLQRKTAPGCWFGKLRRRSGTAIAVIFRLLRPPVGPDGMAPKHTWSCAPEGLCPL